MTSPIMAEEVEWARASADWQDMTRQKPPMNKVLAFRDGSCRFVWLGMNKTTSADGFKAESWATLR
jgi:hypothetical protein